MSDAALWPLALGVLGAVFGSFIATVTLRWPHSAFAGRSHCDGCGRVLHGLELVPIVSWVVLRGRCRTCDGRVAAIHPAVELLGAGIGIAAGVVLPDLAGAAGAIFGWLLLAAGTIDFRTFRLPDPLTMTIAVGGLAAGGVGLSPTLVERAWGGLAGFAALWVVAAGYRLLRGREGLGGGDPRLFGAIGLWLGWRALPEVLLIASLAGLAVAVLLRMRRTARFPFGTVLAPAAFAVWLLQNWTMP
ncbi:prepilin peptidase [Sphingomonas sp.]|uniref:prepilin peptidase n=1 Tax=Sphingomonas sp. TaxID=28214 RepID=UPI002DD6683D|nr:A24 family peptidase [Sphingomonas sp.]